MVLISVTLSDLQGHSPTERLFTCEFSFSNAADLPAVDKTATESVLRSPSVMAELRVINYFSDPARTIGLVCMFVRKITFELNDI